MEDKVANAAAFKGTRRLQVLKFEEYVAVKREVLEKLERNGYRQHTSLLLSTAIGTQSMAFQSMGSAALRCGLPSPCQRLNFSNSCEDSNPLRTVSLVFVQSRLSVLQAVRLCKILTFRG